MVNNFMNRILLILLFSLSILLSNSDNSGAAFKYGVSAKSVGLGGSMVATYHNGFNAFTNPAFLANVNKSESGLSFFRMSLDRSIQAYSYSRPLPPSAGISLSFFRAGVDNILITDGDNNFLRKTSQWEGYGMMSFGISITSNINCGFNIKAIINELDSYSATGIGFDYGMLINISEYFNIGFSIKNIGSKYKWEIGAQKYEEEIPMFSQIGFSYTKLNNLSLSAQFDFASEGDNIFRIGSEYRFNNKEDKIPIVFRSGLKESNANDQSVLFYLGFGIPISISNNLNLILDYSLDPGLMKEGMSHLLSFTLINK